MITAAIAGVFQGVVKPVLDKMLPDAQQRLEAEMLFYKQAHEVNLGQIEINKEEAKHSSIYVAGWRPFIGWVCGGSLAYAIILYSFLNWIIELVAVTQGVTLPALPKPDTGITLDIVLAMLGFGGLRSWEKAKGIAS